MRYLSELIFFSLSTQIIRATTFRMNNGKQNKTSAVSIYVKIFSLIFLSLCVSICIYFSLVLQGFWISAIASQTGSCNLVIYKNILLCNYWSMLLEIITWITIIYVPLVIVGMIIIVVIAFVVLVAVAIFLCGFSIPILILMGEFFNHY